MRFYRYQEATDRLPMRRRRRWQQMGDVDEFGPIHYGAIGPSMVGGVVTAEGGSSGTINWASVATGIVTGMGIWVTTRVLEKIFK